MRTLVLQDHELILRRQGRTLLVERLGTVVHRVPVHEVEEVHVFGGAQLTAAARNALLDAGAIVLFLTRDGRYRARLVGDESAWVERRLAQYRASQNPALRQQVAHSVVHAKINAQLHLLRARNKHLRSDAIRQACERLVDHREALDPHAPVDVTRGHEGAAAACYFGVFGELFTRGTHWRGRNRRPPRDPANACLSFLYTFLLRQTEGAVRAAGLDVNLGNLHGHQRGAPALALDLMEPYRPLVDALTLTLFNRLELTDADFDRPPARSDAPDEVTGARPAPLPGDAVYLGKVGREIALRAWFHARRAERPWAPGPLRLETALREDAHRYRRLIEEATREGEPGNEVPLRPFVPVIAGTP